MNKAQRKTIEDIRGNLSTEHDRIEAELEAEQEKLDNMPESLQEGDKGTAMQEGIDNLQEAMDAVQQAIDAMDNIS